MDLDILKQADDVTLQLEIAKRNLDLAKQKLESAKQRYDDVFSRCDEAGIPKAKLKKLTEERVNALFETGVVQIEKIESAPVVAKVDKNKKSKKKDNDERSLSEDRVISQDELAADFEEAVEITLQGKCVELFTSDGERLL